MRKRFTTAKRVTAMAMAASMAALSLAGCGSSKEEPAASAAATGAATETTTAAAGGESSAEAANTDKPYEGVKLTWWTKLNANVSATYPNLGDTPWAQYIM